MKRLIVLYFLYMVILTLSAQKFYNNELDSHVYEFDFIPASVLLAGDMLSPFKHRIERLVKYGHSSVKTYSVVPSQHDASCIKAVAENVFSGNCNLPDYCVGLRIQILDHTWYGSKVVLCFAYHKHKVDLVTNIELVSQNSDSYFSNVDLGIFFKFYSTQYGIGFLPAKFETVVRLEKDFQKQLNATGDFHAVMYDYYPLQDWYQKIYLTFSSKLNFVPGEIKLITYKRFRFVCGDSRSGLGVDVHQYESQACGSLISIDDTVGYCSNLFAYYNSRRCPLDYLPRRTLSTIRKSVFISTNQGGFISNIVSGIVSGLEKLIEPFAEILINVLGKFLEGAGLLIEKLFDDLEPQLEKIFSKIIDILITLVPFIVKLLMAMLKGIYTLLFALNEDIMILEWIVLYTYFTFYFKDTTSAILACVPFLIFGFARPKILKDIYHSLRDKSEL